MAAGNVSWFANSASLGITNGATIVQVAAIRNIKFTPHFEIAELYGMESLKRQGAARHTHSVDVAIEFAMWDPTADVMLASYLQGANVAAANANTTVLNDSGCRSKTATFHIVATLQDTACASKFVATIYDVYFNDVPMELRENEFMSRNMAGKGASVWLTYSAV